MSYLERLKAEFSENALPGELTKPTKGPSVSFVSARSRHISEIEAVNDSANMLLDRSSEARRQRKAAELARHMRAYADRNGFSEADFDEALQVALGGDVDGWIAYIQSQNATRH